MKLKGYKVKYFSHDDKHYWLRYSPPNNSPKTLTLTIPIKNNGLFQFRTTVGFKSFTSRAPHYCSEYKKFAGAAHVIHDDDENSVNLPPSQATLQHTISCQTRERSDQTKESTREPSAQTREASATLEPRHKIGCYNNLREDLCHAIPHTDSDFIPTNDQPLSSDFDTALNPDLLKEDVSIACTRRKQLRLLTIHETLGNLSFSTLKLMARCGLISKDLQYVDLPTCPGCAYGKAHRIPWRRVKGIRNLRKIRQATDPGQVVSVDQLVSPTPGFVPTHRGLPTR